MKIKKGDTVVVITGKDKGKKGLVVSAFPKESKVLVQEVNMVIRHVPKTHEKAGEKIQKELPIHVSNVMLLDDAGKVSRVGYSIGKNGKKVRVLKTTKSEVIENFNKA